MINKKNAFLTFCFSLVPGAGEMYMGFYKLGGSVMILFLGSAALADYLLPPLRYLLPVLWFYSFFHTHNLNRLPDEEFYAQEDDYLFHMKPETIFHGTWIRHYQKHLAVMLVLFGIAVLWNSLYDTFFQILSWFHVSESVMKILSLLTRVLPQAVCALVIIWLGVMLFKRKKEELLPDPPYLEDGRKQN